MDVTGLSESLYSFCGALAQPFSFCYALLALAIALVLRRGGLTRRQRWSLGAPFVALTIACFNPVAYLAVGSLEWQNPPRPGRPAGVKAIVVLSGGAYRPDSLRIKSHLAADSLLRCIHAAELYHDGPPCLVLASGGRVSSSDAGASLAQMMFEFLEHLEVASENLVIEDRSRSTYENALYSAEMLRARGIDEVVLVSDASHLPRAILCFEKQGIRVHPSGAIYTASEFEWSAENLVPSAGGSRGIARAAHEWLGMLWYRIRGRI